jgi:hypothetical protein
MKDGFEGEMTEGVVEVLFGAHERIIKSSNPESMTMYRVIG